MFAHTFRACTCASTSSEKLTIRNGELVVCVPYSRRSTCVFPSCHDPCTGLKLLTMMKITGMNVRISTCEYAKQAMEYGVRKEVATRRTCVPSNGFPCLVIPRSGSSHHTIKVEPSRAVRENSQGGFRLLPSHPIGRGLLEWRKWPITLIDVC